MSDQYIGEIRMFGGNFAPLGWALCNGSILQIRDNDVLFSLIGATYGGDGQTTFALPDLRGRIPIHQGSGYQTGQQGGAEKVTLASAHVSGHGHTLMATTDIGDASSPVNARLAQGPANIYSTDMSTTAALAADSIQPAGAVQPQPHDNVQPFLCVTFIIALEGNYPTRA